MIAFHDIRADMRATCVGVTAPHPAPGMAPMTRKPERPEAERPQVEGHPYVEPWMDVAFERIIQSGVTGEPFFLIPCLMNGERACVIGIATRRDGKTHITPLFLACQPWMSFSSPPGDSGEDEGGAVRTAAEGPSPR